MSPLRPDSGLLLAALRAESLLVGSPGGLPPITSLATDSRSVAPGALFIAVRGSQADGHLYLASAVAAGAAAVVVERPAGLGIPEIIVTDGGRAAIALARAWYGDPGRRLALVGVTGTSGKTTTTLLVSHLLNARGTAGSIGTLGAFDGGGRMIPSTAGSLTTPGPVDLQATLAGLVDAGVDRVAMETSSHSLDQGRLDGLVFDGAVFTNLSREHLDYHRTMAEYRLAKLKLLDYLAPTGVAAVNGDDPALYFWVAFRTRRHWPLFVAGFQLLIVITHMARLADPRVSGWAYLTAQLLWSYLVLLTIGYASWTAPRYAINAEDPTEGPGATLR